MIHNNQDVREALTYDIGKKNYLDFYKQKNVKRSESIGTILKFLRKRIGFKQQEIAEKVGIKQQTYAGYESGKHEPSIEIMIRLAEVYDTTMDYITGRFMGVDYARLTHEEVIHEKKFENTYIHYALQNEQNKRFVELLQKTDKTQ